MKRAVFLPSSSLMFILLVLGCGGGSSSGGGSSTPPPSAPTLTSLAPTSGPVGTSVLLTGSYLTGATAVSFHGSSATFSVNSATQITATVPAGATTGTVSVSTPGGTAVSASAFTVTLPAPSITSFAPTSGAVGTTVTVTGLHFTGATAAAFNGSAATPTVLSDTQFTAVVPSGATSGPISVTTPGGSIASAASFTVTVAPPPAPSLTSFAPASGPAGTSVVLTGTHLTGATAVSFHGTATTFAVNSATQITASVPAGATTGPVSVTTPGGSAASASNFTVTSSGSGGATLYPAGQIIPAGTSGPRALKVRNASGAWTAASNDAWISITAGATGSGDGSVGYQVSPNAGAAPRTGTLSIAGQTFTVWQDGAQNLVHPRLWMNPGDATRMQGWAKSTNPIYQNGFASALSTATAYANAHWNWTTGVPDTVFVSPYAPDSGVVSGWKDDGGSNWQGDDTEAYAEFFAFASQLQTTQAQRDYYGTRARAMLMWVVSNAASRGGAHGNDFPFGGAPFATYNRANYWGEAFGLTVDWAYPYFSAADKAKIQTAFRMWAADELVASTAGEEHPQPVGVENNLTLLSDTYQLRWAANNYFIGHTRNLTMYCLCLDPADDPAQSGQYPTLGSYRANVTGAWLYQAYAMFTDKATVVSTLGAPASNNSLGLASGGLPVEGSLYGESLGFLFQYLLALHSAGYDDPTISGPQIGLTTSSYWDQSLQGYLLTMTPQSKVLPGLGYLGSVYQMAAYGDMLRSWVSYENIEQWGPLGIFKMREGDPAGWDACRWIAVNALEGGSAMLSNRTANIWGNSNASYSIYYMMMMDPAAAAPADPRPAQPLLFTDTAFSRVLGRSDWGSNATLFTYLSDWQSINHQQGAAGQFELYRKGEWLTKEWDGYGNDFACYTSTYHNNLSVQNDVPTDLAWFEGPTSTLGGQWSNGGAAGDPTTAISSGSGWTFMQSDTTRCYNKPSGGATDVQLVNRSLVWLSPDHVVVYDRAATGKTGRFKRWNLVLTAAPVLTQDAAAHTWKAVATTASGQQLFVQHLLPAGATMVEQHNWTTDPSQEFNLVSEGEEASHRLLVEDASDPTSVRFLHVIQAADAAAAQTASSAIKDATGTAFDIAIVGRLAVAFPINVNSGAASLSFTVPAAVQGELVTGLKPGAGYDLASSSGVSGTTLTLSAGSSLHADSAGVLALGTIAP